MRKDFGLKIDKSSVAQRTQERVKSQLPTDQNVSFFPIHLSDDYVRLSGTYFIELLTTSHLGKRLICTVTEIVDNRN